MKRNMLFGSVLAAALSVGVGAQAGGGSAQTPAREQGSSSRNQAITVTGCLQAAEPSATGTTGSASASASKPDNFVLAKATMGSGAASATGAAPGATGTAPGATSGTAGSATSSASSDYKLTGGSKDELRKYVNSKVEIRGKLDSGASAMSPSAGATGAAPGAGAAGAASSSRASDSGPTLHVDSIKQVSPSCSN